MLQMRLLVAGKR